jgi:hypothetical protein
MRRLTTTELLSIWERGAAQPPIQRSLALLVTACPEASPEDLARLSIGRRDARLLTLREWAFGPQLICLADCPACTQPIELEISTAELRAGMPAETQRQLELQIGSYAVQVRLPDSLDQAAIGGCADLQAARDLLLGRCLKATADTGAPVALDELPQSVIDLAEQQLEQADPLANVELALTCPGCGHSWLAVFDIVEFFWMEIDVWAHRILGEVHTLASAYGWREADILAMSPWRRQIYLEMVGI